jgi:hypothetical protein
MNLLSNLINPKIALNLIRAKIEKSIKKTVNDFSIVYNKNKNDLQFVIDNEVFTLEQSDSIIKIIKNTLKNKVKKGQEIDLIKIDVKSDTISGTLYFTENNIKQYTHFNL